MKTCSFLPAATQMIYDMGLQHLRHGVTFECPPQALAEKDKVVRYALEGEHHSSEEIDRIFSAAKAQGKSLYSIDEALLQRIQPDVIFTQDVCEVCGIDTACTAATVAKLAKQPTLVALTPQSLEDVYATAITIATAVEQEAAAYRYLTGLKERTNAILNKLQTHRLPPKRVTLLEWMEPLYNCGHWIPDQIAQAGGVDGLSNPGGASVVIPWEEITRYNPEVMVIAPCGFDTQRAVEELHLLTRRDGWNNLQAVQSGQVYVTDFDLFTQPSPSTLVTGIEVLAALFHPTIFSLPESLRHKVVNASMMCQA